MDIRVLPRYAGGSIGAVPSKSQAHRALICAALADRPTEILAGGTSRDIETTVGALRALGARVEGRDALTVSPIRADGALRRVDCGESGSTLRFLLPVAAALGLRAQFTGSGRLPDRPLKDLLEQMGSHGVSFSSDRLPLQIGGRLSGGDFVLPGDVSSQYVSGLLLALPAAGGGNVRLSTPLGSRAYADMTVAMLRSFGVAAERTESAYRVPPGAGCRSPGRLTVEGDWSNAAVWLCAGALAGETTVTGLDPASPQGDRTVAGLLQRFGVQVRVHGRGVTAAPGALEGIAFDASLVPDLVPPLSVVAAKAKGLTRIGGVARLRLKECDRLEAVIRLVRAMGCRAESDGATLTITGGDPSGGFRAETFGDHRMVMSAALAALAARAEVRVADAGAVDKSYPDFFGDLARLGGEIHVEHLRG